MNRIYQIANRLGPVIVVVLSNRSRAVKGVIGDVTVGYRVVLRSDHEIEDIPEVSRITGSEFIKKSVEIYHGNGFKA